MPVLALDAFLGDAFAPFFEVPPGIMSPTACMAFELASITTSAAEVATSPIRVRTLFDFFFVAIGYSVRG